jgi:hypothetical protein
MKKLFLLLTLVLLTFPGCASNVQTELEAIQERANLRDEAQSYYVNYFDIGGSGLTNYQKWQYQQFPSVYSTFQAYKVLNPKSTETWENYLAHTDIEKSREQAADLSKQALGLPVKKQQEFINTMGRYLVDDKMGSLLIDFLRADISYKFGYSAANFVCEKIPQLEIEFNGISGHENMSFLEFLKGKYDF